MNPGLRERLLLSAAQAWMYALLLATLLPRPCSCRMCRSNLK